MSEFRLKSCPDTKRLLKLARNRLTRTLVMQLPIKHRFRDANVSISDMKSMFFDVV